MNTYVNVEDVRNEISAARRSKSAAIDLMLESESDRSTVEDYAKRLADEQALRSAAEARAEELKQALEHEKGESRRMQELVDAMNVNHSSVLQNLADVNARLHAIEQKPVATTTVMAPTVTPVANPASSWRVVVGQRDGNGDIKEFMFVPREK